MYTTEVIYQGALRCNATHQNSLSVIQTDAPLDNRGKGERFSPTDLVAAALGSCMLTVMGIAASDKGINLEGSTVSILKKMGISPRRIVTLSGELTIYHSACSEEDLESLRLTAINCPVAKSLHPDINQDIQIQFILRS